MANQIVINKMSANATIFDVVAIAGTVNGSLLAVGAQNSNKTYVVTAPAAVTDNDVVIVLQSTVSYDASKGDNDYVIATNDVVRGYVPYIGMVVTIPQANITATVAIAKNKIVVPDAGEVKMECIDAVGGTEAVVFVVDEIPTVNGVASAKLRCIKA